ncbi:hypothetical protein FHS31_001440 [Sphingomonas vulcanisoli]|uniref:PEP-CTERM sorting domain-containing protein n=1 Tax=Sphingomonas vulcanisoli TaxID=1658060 RepID=A0ABX0TU41_9SPHN|nr:PEP-CTERM sorting domain-containing protein [Sphingomonas vulcanisoli]NIJ07830.1 hypothetical protein [Sphingomonas vulcanisoli]
MVRFLLGAACLLTAVAADATVYTYSFTGSTPVGNYPTSLQAGNMTGYDGRVISQGTFVTSASNAITAMTGTFDGKALSYLTNPSAPNVYYDGHFHYDDLLAPDQSSVLDMNGVAFTIGATEYNLFGTPQIAGSPYYTYDTALAPDNIHHEHWYGNLAITQVTPVTVAGGTQADPTVLTQEAVSAITGSVGPDALDQFYSFNWNGENPFTSTVSIGDAAQSDSFQLILSGNGVNEIVDLNAANGFNATLNKDLLAGAYTIGITATVDVDPSFTITFGSALNSDVPEPTTWETLLGGLGICGATLRKRKTQLRAKIA